MEQEAKVKKESRLVVFARLVNEGEPRTKDEYTDLLCERLPSFGREKLVSFVGSYLRFAVLSGLMEKDDEGMLR